MWHRDARTKIFKNKTGNELRLMLFLHINPRLKPYLEETQQTQRVFTQVQSRLEQNITAH